MKHDRALTSAAGPTFTDFLEWAKETGESRDTIYEIEKVAARLDMTEEELDLVPADLGYFEKVIAVSPYGAVSRSKDLDTARKRGNSRVRAALERFLAARGHATPDAAVRASYDQAIEFIVDNEGFVDRGALFTTSTHRPFLLVRARARLALPDLDQAEFDRLWHDATPGWPEIAAEIRAAHCRTAARPQPLARACRPAAAAGLRRAGRVGPGPPDRVAVAARTLPRGCGGGVPPDAAPTRRPENLGEGAAAPRPARRRNRCGDRGARRQEEAPAEEHRSPRSPATGRRQPGCCARATRPRPGSPGSRRCGICSRPTRWRRPATRRSRGARRP